jgi:hypothetical protein
MHNIYACISSENKHTARSIACEMRSFEAAPHPPPATRRTRFAHTVLNHAARLAHPGFYYSDRQKSASQNQPSRHPPREMPLNKRKITDGVMTRERETESRGIAACASNMKQRGTALLRSAIIRNRRDCIFLILVRFEGV